jgi:hypothetical protein
VAVGSSIVKALKGTGSGYWMALPPLAHAPGSGGTVTDPSLLSYPMVLLGTSLTVGLAYSDIIAGSTAILTLVLACPAAYALARFGLPYSNGLLGVMLALAFFPPGPARAAARADRHHDPGLALHLREVPGRRDRPEERAGPARRNRR